VDPLKYQKPGNELRVAMSDDVSSEWLTVKLRFKAPHESRSQLLTSVLTGESAELEVASESGRFSAAVALFGMLLLESDFKGDGDFDLAQSLARNALGVDPRGERAEFVRLVALAKELKS
jgi:Ca-activated chloride channel family protein